jgi:3-oxoacyl-[acyl-carrier-protein] synthase-1
MNQVNFDGEYPVCIAGVGARTPLGLNAPASAAAVRAAIGGIREHPYFVDKAGEPMSVTMDPVLLPELDGVDRLQALAVPAMLEALAPLHMSRMAGAPVPAFIGLPEPRPGRPANLDQELARRLERDLAVHVTVIPHGHASGLMALEQAWRIVRNGQAEFCLAGGVDSYLEPETLEWLDQEKQLLSDENRLGFPPGEGAGFCLVALATAARRLRMSVLAWIVTAATTTERNLIKTDNVCVGKGLSDLFTQITSVLKVPDERINTTYCDMNGERYRSEEFAFTVLRTQFAFVDAMDNLTPADCWGDMGAASGGLFAALAIASGLRRYASGPRAFMWAGSEAGKRSAVLLHLHTPSADELP